MKTVLLIAAALIGGAAYAHASDAYSDPGEYRAPGVTVPASAATFTMPDTTTTPGATFPTSALQSTGLDTTMNPGMSYPTSASHVATQTGQ